MQRTLLRSIRDSQVRSIDLISKGIETSGPTPRMRSDVVRRLALGKVHRHSQIRLRLDVELDRIRDCESAVRNYDRLVATPGESLEGVRLDRAHARGSVEGQGDCDFCDGQGRDSKGVGDAQTDLGAAD